MAEGHRGDWDQIMIVVVIAVRITSHFVKDHIAGVFYHVGGVLYHVGGVCDLRMITVGKLS